MPSIRVTVKVEQDGLPFPGLEQLVFRLQPDEIQHFLPYEKAADALATTFTSLPVEQVGSISFLLLTPDRQQTFRLDGQTNAGIVLGANGLLLIINGVIDDGASTNVTVNNSAGAVATIRGLAAGT